VQAVATDPSGRIEGQTVPDATLAACLRDARPGTAGWLLLRVEYEVVPRPTKVVVIEREGLDDAIASCVVSAIEGHDELWHLAPTRFVHVSAW
jgi:hypothetical protein